MTEQSYTAAAEVRRHYISHNGNRLTVWYARRDYADGTSRYARDRDGSVWPFPCERMALQCAEGETKVANGEWS